MKYIQYLLHVRKTFSIVVAMAGLSCYVVIREDTRESAVLDQCRLNNHSKIEANKNLAYAI